MSDKLQKLKFKRKNDEELLDMQKTRPYALSLLQTQLSYDQASMLNDLVEQVINLRQDQLKLVPSGVLDSLNLEITNSPTILKPKDIASMPWMTCTVFNDGDDPVYLTANEEFVNSTTPLYKGEKLRVDMGKAQIKKLSLYCITAGQTADVRIFAIK